MIKNYDSPEVKRFKAIIERFNAHHPSPEYGDEMILAPLEARCDYCDVLPQTVCAYATREHQHYSFFDYVTEGYALCVGLTIDGEVVIHVYTCDEKLDTVYLPSHLSTTEDLEFLEELLVRTFHIMCFGANTTNIRSYHERRAGYWEERIGLLEDFGYINHGSKLVENATCNLGRHRFNEAIYKETITFGGEQDHEDGWALILAGGPSSGKSFTLGNCINFKSKVLNVDDLKDWYVAAVEWKKGRGLTDAEKDDPEIMAYRKNRVSNLTKDDERDYDFGNPDDVGDLHYNLDHLAKNREKIFFGNLEGRLPNVTFDITGPSPKHESPKQDRVIKLIKDANPDGPKYKISYCLIVANREIALINNLSRSRIIPEESFHSKHTDVVMNSFNYLRYQARDIDEAWLYISPINDAKLLKENPELGVWAAQNRMIRLKKKGDGFFIPDDVEENITKIFGSTYPEDYLSSEEIKQASNGDLASYADKVRNGDISLLRNP